MNENQRAAFVMARAAILIAEITAMKANNDLQIAAGNGVCYDGIAFRQTIETYPDLEYNNVLAYLREGK